MTWGLAKVVVIGSETFLGDRKDGVHGIDIPKQGEVFTTSVVLGGTVPRPPGTPSSTPIDSQERTGVPRTTTPNRRSQPCRTEIVQDSVPRVRGVVCQGSVHSPTLHRSLSVHETDPYRRWVDCVNRTLTPQNTSF